MIIFRNMNQNPEVKLSSEKAGIMDRPVHEVASLLRESLDDPLIARIVGVSEGRAVKQWAAGERMPNPTSEFRLRLTTHLTETVRENDRPWICKNWLISHNPHFRDSTPVSLIQSLEGKADEAQTVLDLCNAANDFVKIGQSS